MHYRLGVLKGDGIGPEIVEATLRRPGGGAAAGRAPPLRVGPAPHGVGGDPGDRERLAGIRRRGAQEMRRLGPGPARLGVVSAGPAGDAQPERRAAPPLRPVREHPPGARVSRPARRLSPDGPGDRAGEHRGILRRSQHVLGDRRVHADPGCGVGRRQDHPAGHRSGSRGRHLRWRASGDARSRSSTRPMCSARPPGCSWRSVVESGPSFRMSPSRTTTSMP